MLELPLAAPMTAHIDLKQDLEAEYGAVLFFIYLGEEGAGGKGLQYYFRIVFHKPAKRIGDIIPGCLGIKNKTKQRKK